MQRTLNSKPRSSTGKNEMNRLRTAGFIPGNLISDGKSIPISFAEADFQKLLSGGLRQSSFFDVKLEGGDDSRVYVKEIQRHPVTGKVLHVDLYRITPGRQIALSVAIETRGVSKGVKAGGAMEHFIRGVKIRANPESVKEVIEVDVSNLDVGASLHLSDLDIPKDWDVRMPGDPIVIKVAASRTSRAQDTDAPETAEAAVAAPAEAKS